MFTRAQTRLIAGPRAFVEGEHIAGEGIVTLVGAPEVGSRRRGWATARRAGAAGLQSCKDESQRGVVAGSNRVDI